MASQKSFIVPSLFLMSFWPHIIFGSPTDLWPSLTFEILHVTSSSSEFWEVNMEKKKTTQKTITNNIAAFVQDWNWWLDKLIRRGGKPIWQKCFLFLIIFLFIKTDLKVLYRDWHSSWSLMTIAICDQGSECWFLTDYFQNSWRNNNNNKKKTDLKSPELCKSFYIFQAV